MSEFSAGIAAGAALAFVPFIVTAVAAADVALGIIKRLSNKCQSLAGEIEELQAELDEERALSREQALYIANRECAADKMPPSAETVYTLSGGKKRITVRHINN